MHSWAIFGVASDTSSRGREYASSRKAHLQTSVTVQVSTLENLGAMRRLGNASGRGDRVIQDSACNAIRAHHYRVGGHREECGLADARIGIASR
jgi:hypothetical protein